MSFLTTNTILFYHDSSKFDIVRLGFFISNFDSKFI